MVGRSVELAPGRHMGYELLAPAGYDPSRPANFLISVSGVQQTHVNGFSRRLPCEDWVVVVPLRPPTAPLLFEGRGEEGDGLWHLGQFCRQILRQHAVETGRFVMVGVSNGGNAVLRFAMLWPELCRGVVAVTAGLSPEPQELVALQGVPVDMYVGTNDECGFFPAMVSLEANMRAASVSPAPTLTVYDGIGHMCSPYVDQDLVFGKIYMMLLRSAFPGRGGGCLRLPRPAPGFLPSEDIAARLRTFCAGLGLECEASPEGGLLVKPPGAFAAAAWPPQEAAKANVFTVRQQQPNAPRPADPPTPLANNLPRPWGKQVQLSMPWMKRGRAASDDSTTAASASPLATPSTSRSQTPTATTATTSARAVSGAVSAWLSPRQRQPVLHRQRTEPVVSHRHRLPQASPVARRLAVAAQASPTAFPPRMLAAQGSPTGLGWSSPTPQPYDPAPAASFMPPTSMGPSAAPPFGGLAAAAAARGPVKFFLDESPMCGAQSPVAHFSPFLLDGASPVRRPAQKAFQSCVF